MSEAEIRFTETEVAQILWALTDATEHAASINALSAQIMLEETLRMVRARFDER